MRNQFVRRSGWSSLVALLLGAAPVLAAEVYVPVPLADKIKQSETTELDIGDPSALFDADTTTLIRTPAINPATIQVAFTEPVTFEHLRVIMIDAKHTVSLAVADSMRDLKAERGSYREIFTDRVTPGGRLSLTLDRPITFTAFELTVLRQQGDDYVHVAEVQFCNPGKVDAIQIKRIVDRRNATSPASQKPVEGIISEPTQTVVWLKAQAVADGTPLQVEDDIEWTALTNGVEPFGDEPGMFVITDTGLQRVAVKYGPFEREIQLKGTPREIENRAPDVEILFIERLPRIPFDGPNNGLPPEGSTITWRAHLYNWGTEPIEVDYAWYLDGARVTDGRATIPVGPPSTTGTPIDLPWQWSSQRHDLKLAVKPVKPVQELITKNNTLTIQTDAITVGFWVEQSLWEHHHEHQHRLPTKDANSFAGWSQRMMRVWNEMFSRAKFTEYPDGIVERVRLDRLVVVPDFALPLAGGLPSNNPDLRDKTIDMTWGMESNEIEPGVELSPDHWWAPERAIKAFENGDIENKRQDPPFWCGLGYIHELAHARYLVDAYGFNVHTGFGEDISKRNLRVTDENGPILGRYMPIDVDLVHWRKFPGQMGGNYWEWSVFDAMCWNRVAGQRARGGNCNSPSVIGEFLNDIPEELVYQFVDEAGNPLSNAEIWVYRPTGNGKDWYAKVFDDIPDLKGRCDAEGRFVTERTLWDEKGVIRHTFGHSNGKVLVRVTYDGQHYYLFEEVTDANLAYNLGHKDTYTFKRQIKLRDGEPSPDEWDVDMVWDAPGTGFGRSAASSRD